MRTLCITYETHDKELFGWFTEIQTDETIEDWKIAMEFNEPTIEDGVTGIIYVKETEPEFNHTLLTTGQKSDKQRLYNLFKSFIIKHSLINNK